MAARNTRSGPAQPPDFAAALTAWQRAHGRHDLPWQGTRDPYRIWLSEIMLQQTQVAAVLGYYERFLTRFADVHALAQAPLDAVMQSWSGLGYYSRARNLHAAARMVVEHHGGNFPSDPAVLETLPGIGRSTAAAIAVFAFGARAAILDGNVKRVLCRVHAIEGWPGSPAVQARLWTIAEAALPDSSLEAYTQGLMDLGATVCTRTRPACGTCPFGPTAKGVGPTCRAHALGLTARLPAARPRKPVPQRTIGMLMIRAGEDLLLERRPESGIWGGLWSLPECSAGLQSHDIAMRVSAMGLTVRCVDRLEDHEHGFTHFRLRVEPWLVDVRAARVHATRPAGTSEPRPTMWLAWADVETAGVPAPLRRLARKAART